MQLIDAINNLGQGESVLLETRDISFSNKLEITLIPASFKYHFDFYVIRNGYRRSTCFVIDLDDKDFDTYVNLMRDLTEWNDYDWIVYHDRDTYISAYNNAVCALTAFIDFDVDTLRKFFLNEISSLPYGGDD